MPEESREMEVLELDDRMSIRIYERPVSIVSTPVKCVGHGVFAVSLRRWTESTPR